MPRFPLLSFLSVVAALPLAPAVAARAQQFGPPEAKPELPPPYQTRAGSFPSHVIGWPDGKTPVAPAGFRVNLYAELDNARWPYVLPNGDVLVAQSDSGRITLFRGLGADGRPAQTEVFLRGLNKPFGMLVLEGAFYLGETNKLSRFPYQPGQTRLDPAQGKKILDLPAGGYNNHWTRNVVARPDGKKLLSPSGPPPTSGSTAWKKKPAVRACWRSTRTARASASSPRGCVTRWVLISPRARACRGRWSTSATTSATTSCPTT